MNTPISSRPLRTAVINFLCLTGVCAAIAAAAKSGLIDSETTKRGLGFCIGGIMADIGNLIPKLRPLRLPGLDPAKGVAAERFAGWTLYLAAVIYVALFAFASLDHARIGAAAVGISAVVLIAMNWGWLLRRHSLRGPLSDRTGDANHKEHRLLACLLFSLAYLLFTACWVNLFGSGETLALWATVGFSGAFAVFYAILGSGFYRKH